MFYTWIPLADLNIYSLKYKVLNWNSIQIYIKKKSAGIHESNVLFSFQKEKSRPTFNRDVKLAFSYIGDLIHYFNTYLPTKIVRHICCCTTNLPDD